ncbi:MAG: hypothetical protein JXR71_13105 [Bacteroidales bacterium]|nr:hypothetical protein [Bacteroidales bacterium]
MYKVLLHIHIWSSVLFMLVSLVFSVLLFVGIVKKSEYSAKYVWLENSFIGLLYLGLFLGITLYFMMPADKYFIHSADQVSHVLSLRFWSIEHFSVMLFAVLLAQIGKIFTVKSYSAESKFKYALFYYGFATALTLTSMTFYLIYKA